MIISGHAHASLEIRYSQFDYRWWDYASFPVTAVMIGYTGWHHDYGLTVLYGNSTKAKNTRSSPYSNLSARIENLTIIGIRRRKRFTWGSVEAGLNYTYYRERITGPNLNEPNMDYGTGFNLSVSHTLADDFSVKISYDTLYRKQKLDYGYEITNANSISLVYDF